MAKELTSIDFANKELAKGLSATLNEKAQGEWFAKAVAMLQNQEISVRGLQATIELASDSTWLKESHVAYFINGAKLRAKDGGDKVALKKVITTVQDAKRAFGKDFDAKLESAKTFNAFAKSIPPREPNTRGAGETADEKALAVKLEDLDMDGLVEVMLECMRNLEVHFIGKKDNAKMLLDIVRLAIKNSNEVELEASIGRHPANA
jgi:hypothetical protein